MDSNEENTFEKYGRFIEQNKYRIPNFQSVEAAETALKNINEKFKQPNYRLQSKNWQKSLDEKIEALKDQHKAIVEEQQRIDKYKITSENALQKEDEEYKALKNKIAEAKGKLADAQFIKTNSDAELKKVQSEYEAAIKKNKLLQTQVDQLITEQKELSNYNNQLKNDLRILDEQSAQHSENEKRVENLENTILEKQKRYNELLQKHQQYMNRIKAIDAETQRYMRIADEKGNEYEDILNNVRTKHQNALGSDSEDIDMSQFKSALMSTPNRSTFISETPVKSFGADSSMLKTPNRQKMAGSVYTTPKANSNKDKFNTPKVYNEPDNYISPYKKVSPPHVDKTPIKDSLYGLSSFMDDSPKPIRSALRKGPKLVPNDNRVHFDATSTQIHALSSDDNLESDNFLDSDSLLDEEELPSPSLTNDLVQEALRAINQNVIDISTIMNRH